MTLSLFAHILHHLPQLLDEHLVHLLAPVHLLNGKIMTSQENLSILTFFFLWLGYGGGGVRLPKPGGGGTDADWTKKLVDFSLLWVLLVHPCPAWLCCPFLLFSDIPCPLFPGAEVELCPRSEDPWSQEYVSPNYEAKEILLKRQ